MILLFISKIMIQAVIGLATPAAGAEPPVLETTPMDSLFAYEKPYQTCNYPLKENTCQGQCAYMKIFYDEMKHVNGRDVIPGKVAKPERIDLNGIEKRKLSIPFSGGEMSTYEVGGKNPKDCKLAVIFIHGAAPQKGELGVNDEMFGGNFNRLKHLVVDNGGVYYSPSVDFDDSGTKGVSALLAHIQKTSCPNSRTFLTCASAGSKICWDISENRDAITNLSGIVITGGAKVKTDLAESLAATERLPILILHGERDDYEEHEKMYESLKKLDKNYPVRFVLFSSGGHGTPIRMIDWRDSLNCLLAQSRPAGERNNQSIPEPKTKSQ